MSLIYLLCFTFSDNQYDKVLDTVFSDIISDYSIDPCIHQIIISFYSMHDLNMKGCTGRYVIKDIEGAELEILERPLESSNKFLFEEEEGPPF